MNVIIVASLVTALTLVIGVFLAVITFGFSKAVTKEQQEIEHEKSRYNPSLTQGHKIPVDGDVDEQLIAARRLAAREAAALPRGANMKIGSSQPSEQSTAFDGVKNDPVSAVKIASYHGWEGLRTGAVSADVSADIKATSVAETVAPTKSPSDLKPGIDYPFIEITDDMEPAEIRKARIANAKARSAAVKALKESGAAMTATEAAPSRPPAEVTSPPASTAPAPVSTPAPSMGEPVPGVDYPFIEITEDMDQAEIRKSRIANAKAKSAAMKAFKESGGQMSQGPAVAEMQSPPEVSSPVSAPVEPSAPTPVAVPTDIPKPEYIEITDDMDPSSLRAARIHNAKAKSAYNRALKEAGIDPASLEE